MGFTLYQALLSVFFSAVFGLPGAYFLAKYEFRFKKFVRSVFIIPFIIPSILVILGFVIFFGNRGFLATVLGRQLHILYSFKAILLAHVFYNFPIIAILCADALEKLDRNVEEDAILSGATEMRIFFKITLPRIIPALLSAMVLVFLFCFTSFSIILVLGGGPAYTTTEVEIYRQASLSLNFKTAGALSFFSMFICVIFLFLKELFSSRNYYKEDSTIIAKPLKSAGIYTKVLAFAYLTVAVVFILGPVISIALRSFMGTATRSGALRFNLNGYKNLNFGVFVRTCLIALFSSLVAVFIAYSFCRFKFGFISMFPMAVSSVIIGLVYLIMSRYVRNAPPILIISLMHGIINLPFAYKTIHSAYKNIPAEYGEWGKMCGVPTISYMVKVELPVLKRPLISAFLFCFALSCGELNSTLILGFSKVSTVSVQIMRMISSYNYQGACAAGSVLIVMNVIVFALMGSLGINAAESR